ncbi:DUF692 domain-containing protein [Curvibacter sp. RS43]|uniref:DUF692 domain-containing protein n=1 Tax=Curvibacter microcysteis TaxID=3026419 RepID=UPI00235E1394|nr:DUF692 domain-containing protein [Curvibacter sp. RS43]MDD0810982.1 DUF692 domain-containing protein [Curvibacter sp. RS43]
MSANPTAQGPAMTEWVGIGWRQPHYREVLETPPPLGFLEVHSENFFGGGGAALGVLMQARAHYPISLHGVGLSLGSACGLDPWHLDQLAQLVRQVDPVRVSEHASFARAAWPGQSTLTHGADLLPLPWTQAALTVMAQHVDQVQDRLQRPLAIENLSAYVRWPEQDMDEVDFLVTLCRRTGCQLLVDLNNLHVNAQNAWRAQHGAQTPAALEALLAPSRDWLAAVPADCVAEIHLAGHSDSGSLVIDDHSRAVAPAVWSLYREALQRWGPRPTLLEWDHDLPDLATLLAEADQARQHLARLPVPEEAAP